MAEAIRVSGPSLGDRQDPVLRDRQARPAEPGRRRRASIGRTTVLATANAAKDVRPGIDFFPLTVDVEERAYAAGKIPGSFFRREGRPTEDAILTCRLTDRPLRPSFPDGLPQRDPGRAHRHRRRQENPHDVLAINAASASLMISRHPVRRPDRRRAHRLQPDGKWIPHPTYEEGDASTFELVVAGRELDNGDVAIMMVEAGGTAKSFEYYDAGAPKVDEDVLAGGLEACKVWIKESIALQRQLVAAVIATDGPITPMTYTAAARLRRRRVRRRRRRSPPTALAKAVTIAAKAERNAATDAAAAEAIAELCGPKAPRSPAVSGRSRKPSAA